MAKLVGVFAHSHSNFCYSSGEGWNAVRDKRPLRPDVPRDSVDENLNKAERMRKGFAELRAQLLEARTDVIVVFGDDQLECFDFRNFPAFAVYVGAEFNGNSSQTDIARQEGNLPDAPKQQVRGHPEFATGLLTGIMKRGFDPAYCMDMPKPDRGLGHAFMRPAESLGAFSIPVVPVLFNCYYAPQPTAMRCYQLGRAVREVIDEFRQDLRIAVVGSGGLWHTPRARGAYLDEEFDRQMLERLKRGDAHGMAEYFDNYQIPTGDTSQDVGTRNRECTGMPGLGGPQGGTRETCTWIAAAGACEGRPWTVVDYIPLYASPIGVGLAYCTAI